MDKESAKPELLCRVCGDKASGKHYGVSSCDGCRGFFKRSIRRNLDYVCKENNSCIVDVTRRNQCQACRFRKCLEVNMKREAVQHERAPRATTSKPKYLSQFAGSGSGGFAPYYFPIKPTFYPPFFGSASAAAAAGLTSGFPLGMLPTSRSALVTGNGLGSSLNVGGGTGGGGGSSIFPPSTGVTIGDTAAAAAAAAAVVVAQHHHSPFTSMLVHTKRSSSSSTISNSSNSPTDNNSGKDITVVHTSSSNRSSAERNNESSSGNLHSHPHHHNHRNGGGGGGPGPGGIIASEDEVSSSGGEQDQQHHFPHLHNHSNHYKFLETLHVNTLVNESIYESAAKLLFLSVKWARSVPSFLNLPFEDQALLLEEAWPELFILSGAQWGLRIDEGVLVSGSVVPRIRQSTLHADARLLRETLERIQGIRPDHTELACLKALVLFKPEIPAIREHLQVEVLQDQTHVMLQEYCIGRTPPNKIRFGKLLLLLPLIRRISGKILEELFFKQTVGDIPIERLLSDMFKS